MACAGLVAACTVQLTDAGGCTRKVLGSMREASAACAARAVPRVRAANATVRIMVNS